MQRRWRPLTGGTPAPCHVYINAGSPDSSHMDHPGVRDSPPPPWEEVMGVSFNVCAFENVRFSTFYFDGGSHPDSYSQKLSHTAASALIFCPWANIQETDSSSEKHQTVATNVKDGWTRRFKLIVNNYLLLLVDTDGTYLLCGLVKPAVWLILVVTSEKGQEVRQVAGELLPVSVPHEFIMARPFREKLI